jgi:thioesterase domain-containing protein
VARYRPRALASRGVLFRALDSYKDPRYDACLGWSRLFTEGVEIVEVPGDHSSMWQEPRLSTLAQACERSLDALKRQVAVSLVVGIVGSPNGLFG